MASEQEVLDIKRRLSARLLGQPGISGVGVEKDEQGNFVLAVHLDPAHPAPGTTIPDVVEGVPVRRIRSGPFLKQ
jgi:hypothetical protein